MGCCITRDEFVSRVALKFPHGKEGVEYSEQLNGFVPCKDINKWIQEIYKKSWTNWILYNDDMKDSHHKKGHCKGIVAWNESHISWLCHSVPNFPISFDHLEILESELIYGQSFYNIILPFHNDTLSSIVQQLYIMQANIYIMNTHLSFPKKINKEISTLLLTDNVTHIAKSPHHCIDIYSECIAQKYPCNWRVETWKRGHEIHRQIPNMKDVISLQYQNCEYSEKQDHSKWGVSDTDYFWIGDLNRMTSQYHRGGGGFICKNKDISVAFRSLIKQ